VKYLYKLKAWHDKYKAYQAFNNEWVRIVTDLEIIQTEEIAMSAQVLLNISKDERERARLTSEYNA